jgi:hypothetical protein
MTFENMTKQEIRKEIESGKITKTTFTKAVHMAWCHPIMYEDYINNWYEVAGLVASLKFGWMFVSIVMTISGINWIIGISKGNVKIRDDKRKVWMVFDGKEWIDEK